MNYTAIAGMELHSMEAVIFEQAGKPEEVLPVSDISSSAPERGQTTAIRAI